MDLNKETLWSILEIGDRSIQKLKKKVCMILGLSKNGKSCLFNDLLGKPMIGAQDKQDCQRIIYVPKISSGAKPMDYAEMGSGPTSMTLAPNIADLNNDITLIDMLGFQENRDQKSTLCVSYFLRSCFDMVQSAKFIIAISQQNLLSNQMQVICNSFDQLIDMMALDKFSPAMKENFLDSIFLVITSAKNTLSYNKTRVKTVVKHLSNTQLETIKNREIVKLILQKVCEKDKIECFVQAELNKPNQKSIILNKLNMKGWCEFSIKEAKQKKLINIRFKQHFKKLPQKFSVRFKETIQKKIQNLLSINIIFNKYLQELRINWNNRKLLQIPPYQTKHSVLEILQQQIYQKKAIHERNLKIPINTKQNMFQIATKSTQLFEYKKKLQAFCQSQVPFDKQMKVLTVIYGKMIQCLIPAFTKPKDLQNLVQLQFLLTRSFKQFTQFNQLDPGMITTITRDMSDKCNFQISKREHLEHFMKQLNRNTLNSHFKNLQSLNQYQNLLDKYWQIMISDKLANDQFMLKYLRMKLISKEIKEEILKSTNRKWSILINQIELIQILTRIFKLLKSPNLNWTSDEIYSNLANPQSSKSKIKKKDDSMASLARFYLTNKNQKIEEYYYNLKRNLNTLIFQLQQITKSQLPTQAFDDAIRLCDLVKNPTLAERILTKAYLEENDENKKIKILDLHISICRKWGWLQKASSYLNLKIEYHLSSMDYAKVKQTENELKLLGEMQIKWSQVGSTMENLQMVFNQAEIKQILSILNSMNKYPIKND